MKEYVLEFAREFDFPREAIARLTACCDCLTADPALEEEFETLLGRYEARMDTPYPELTKSMKALSHSAGIHEYEGAMLLIICMAKILKGYYARHQIPEEIWRTSMMDIKWKLDECIRVYGIWGTFVDFWFSRFFNLTRFGFGKLQFDLMTLGRGYAGHGIQMTPESPALNVHIPRTGTRLDIDSLRSSYAQAARFFRQRYEAFAPGKPLVFKCSSWLLFPKHAEVLKPGSNLMAFFSDYEILEEGLYDDYEQVWRLFDVHYNGDPEQLPQDSSLRRTYADWIRKGEKTGWGFGIYIYPD